MKKPNYWLTALLCGAMVVSTTMTSCNKDDDDNNGGTEVVAGEKPVLDKDFSVSVQDNVVTIKSNLTYSNQWVNYAGATYTIKDGVATIEIPIEGKYSMTLAYFNDNKTVVSDEFEVTIAKTNLAFLDKGIYKALTGGQAAYEAAAKTADDKGVFTRTWRIDGFLNSDDYAYSKVFTSPGSFALESKNECYNGGVSFDGNGSWRPLGAAEDATISFDFVHRKVKVVFKDAVKCQQPAGTTPANKEDKLTGTFYGTFTATEIEGSDAYLAANDGYFGTTTEIKGLEITLDGDNVRIPFLKGAMSIPMSKESDVKTIKVFSSVSNEENEQGILIQSAVSYNVEQDETTKAITAIKDDYCNIMMAFVCEELDDTYTYSSETPQYVEPINTGFDKSKLIGSWGYYDVPYNWIGWELPTADDSNPAGKVLNDWFIPSDMEDWAKIDEGASKAEFTFNEDGTCNINGTETTYEVEEGIITFAKEVEFKAGTVDLKGTEFYIVNADLPGIAIGQKNGDKNETSAVVLFNGFTAGGGFFSTEDWQGDWNSNITVTGNGDYDIDLAFEGSARNALYIDFNYVLYKYKDFAATINSIEIDGKAIEFDAAKLAATKVKGDSQYTVRYYLVNPWGANALGEIELKNSVKINVTVSGM